MGLSMKILGFSGRKGTGKTTLCQFLKRNSQELFSLPRHEVWIFHPANNSKSYCCDLFALNHFHVFGTSQDKENLSGYYSTTIYPTRNPNPCDDPRSLTVREFLEWWATLVCSINPEGPIRDVMTQIQVRNPKLALVDGIRKEHEVEIIRAEQEGKVIRLLGGAGGGEWESSLEQVTFDGYLSSYQQRQSQVEKDLVGTLKEWGWLT